MPAQATFEPIATVTSFGSNVTFSFTSIPQTYTDLFLAGSLRGVNAGTVEYLLIKLNSLTAQQSYTSLVSDGATPVSNRNSPSITGGWCYGGFIVGNAATSNIYSPINIHIPEYTGATNKIILARAGSDKNGSGSTEIISNIGLTTSAVTSITVQGSNGTMGSLTLYGIKAA